MPLLFIKAYALNNGYKVLSKPKEFHPPSKLMVKFPQLTRRAIKVLIFRTHDLTVSISVFPHHSQVELDQTACLFG